MGVMSERQLSGVCEWSCCGGWKGGMGCTHLLLTLSQIHDDALGSIHVAHAFIINAKFTLTF